MSTLKEAITEKLKFDQQACQKYIEDVFMNLPKDEMNEEQLNDAGCFYVGSQWQHEQMKQDLLPILLEMAQALEICVNTGDTRYRDLDSNGQEFEGDMAVDALSKLEQWARGSK